MIIGGIRTKLVDNAHCWHGGLAIDADGGYRAYHPDGKSGLDYLANAGKPGHWYGLVCGPDGEPIVQGENDPAPGFYVSPTALADKTLDADGKPLRPVGDPRRYVDSETVPYISVPPVLRGTVMLGDVAMVVRLATGATCAATVADVGPPGKLGEGSPALASALGIPSSARNGGCSSGLGFVIFCGSKASPAWPRGVEDIDQQARGLFDSWGGLTRLSTQVA